MADEISVEITPDPETESDENAEVTSAVAANDAEHSAEEAESAAIVADDSASEADAAAEFAGDAATASAEAARIAAGAAEISTQMVERIEAAIARIPDAIREGLRMAHSEENAAVVESTSPTQEEITAEDEAPAAQHWLERPLFGKRR